MPSTYTPNSGIEKPGSGEQSGTWGTTVNTNMDIIDRSVNGVKSIALSGSSSTLTTSDGLLSDGHHALLRFTGTLAGTHTVTISPSDAQKIYFVRNSTDQTVTFSQGSGSSTADVGSGESGIVYADGSDECHNLTDLLAIPTAVQTELDTITANDWVTNARIATGAVNADSIAAGAVGTSELASDSVTNAKIATGAVNADSIAADAVGASEIAANAVGASELNVSGNGTSSQFLRSDGDGTFTWATPTDTTYTGGGNYGITISGTEIRLEDDRRRNSNTVDIYSGNTHDYTFYDASIGIRWYTEGAEEMRLQNDGDLHVDGNITAYSTTVSDERLKTDIERIEGALDKVCALSGYTFTYKHDGKASAGVVAQEVEKVLPSAVIEKELAFQGESGQEYKIVQYDQLHGLLIEAIKELKAEIEELKNGVTV